MRILLTIILLFLTAFNDKAREGNRAYERGDYETAAKMYMEAIQEEPENARLYFNLGNALSKMGKPAEAAMAWDQFKELNESPLEKSKAVYNQGNSAAEQKEWDKALQAYRNALKLNPNDLDAKYNYELAVKQKQEQEQEQNQEQQQDQKQDQEQNQDQQQQQQQQQNQDQNQDQQQGQDQNQDQQQQQQQQQQKPQFDPGSMTKEQARDMLNALESQERDLLKDLKKQKAPSSYRNAKDW
jgi:Ca-activated chloride channel family protein